MYTSKDHGHRHKYNKRNMYTSFDAGHKHKINWKRRIALKSGTDHTHKLM